MGCGGGVNRFSVSVTQGAKTTHRSGRKGEEVGSVGARHGESRAEWPELLAHVDPLGEAALLAQYVAAPVEAAVAALAARLLQDVVSAAAAQRAAAVRAVAGLVAQAPLRAWRVHRWVPLAKVGRLLEVDQLPGQAPPPPAAQSSAGRLCAVQSPHPGVEDPAVLVLGVDEDGRQELVLQQGADHPELWRDVPAGLELAASRRAVTLALPLHVVGNDLRKKKTGPQNHIGCVSI